MHSLSYYRISAIPSIPAIFLRSAAVLSFSMTAVLFTVGQLRKLGAAA